MNMDAFIEHSPKLYDLAREVADTYRNELRDRGAVAQGDLKNFKYDVEMTDTGLDVVFNLPEYWKWIEYGRPPTTATPKRGPKPLRDLIKEWLETKGINPYKISRDGLAYLITRKIHKTGYKARHPLQQAMLQTRIQQERMADIVCEIMLEEIKKEEI